jgi:hypothetical protein
MVNPNMPLRFLTYVGWVYEKLTSDDAKYGHALLKIPRPVLIVLYNDEEAYPEQKTLKLSDAFKDAGELLPVERTYLELEVVVYNVNKGKNAELVQRSRMLTGYVTFIGKYKEKIKAGMTAEDAIREAIEECISEGILSDYLKQHGSEVWNLLLTEWSNEQAMRVQRREGKDEGIAEGEARGEARGIELGRFEGEARGEAKKQREIAKKMLRRGTPIEYIIEDTGLSPADIKALQAQFA